MIDKISGLSKVSSFEPGYFKRYKNGIAVEILPLFVQTKKTKKDLYEATIFNDKGTFKELRTTTKRILEAANTQLILDVLKGRKLKGLKKQRKFINDKEATIMNLNKEIMKMPGDSVYIRFIGTFDNLTKTLKLKSQKAVMAIIASRK